MQGSWWGLSGEPFCSPGIIQSRGGDGGSGYLVVSGRLCQCTALKPGTF